MFGNIFNSDRILIRDIQEFDADAIFSYRSLESVARFQYWEPYTRGQTLEFINRCKNPDLSKNGEWIGMAIISKEHNQLIGDCALKVGEESAEIGCNISPLYQGKRFATEVLKALISYCFNRIDIKEVYGITDSENKASVRLMKSVGMSQLTEFEGKFICKGVECIEHKYFIRDI